MSGLVTTDTGASKVALVQLVERLRGIAGRKQATLAQIALAWVLHQGDFIVPIPGADASEHSVSAAREIGLFFPEGIVNYDYAAYGWIYDPVEELKK